jgi:hypothetical protein
MKLHYNLFLIIFFFFNTNFINSQNDLSITGTSLVQDQYTQIPLEQVALMATGGVIENIGTAESTNVVLTVSVFDSSSSIVYTESSNQMTLVAGSVIPITFNGYTPTLVDTYTTTYNLTLAETDQNPSNNIVSSSIEVTESIYARDNNVRETSFGFLTATGKMGQSFDILNTQDVVSISFELFNPDPAGVGDTVLASIWDTVNNVPNVKIAETNPVSIVNGANLYTPNLVGGPLTLQPGKYVFVVEETTDDTFLGLSATNDIFTPGAAWFTSGPVDAWINFELVQEVALIIRPNFQNSSLDVSDYSQINNAITLYPNPSNDFIQISGLSQSEVYTIYNVLGVKINNGIISDNEKFNIQNYSNGIYFMKLENGVKLKFVKK